MRIQFAKWARVVPLIFLLNLFLFKFQNCGGPQGVQSLASDSEVRLIDGWDDSSKLAFMSPTYLVQEAAKDVEVHGFCPVEEVQGQDSLVDWQLVRLSDGAVVLNGQSDCQAGGFQLQVTNVDFESCQTRYEIRAQSVSTSIQTAVTTLKAFCDTQI